VRYRVVQGGGGTKSRFRPPTCSDVALGLLLAAMLPRAALGLLLAAMLPRAALGLLLAAMFYFRPPTCSDVAPCTAVACVQLTHAGIA
jgi:hypothetical protein